MSEILKEQQITGATAGQESLDSDALIMKGVDLFDLPEEEGGPAGPPPVPGITAQPTGLGPAEPEPIATGPEDPPPTADPETFRFKSHSEAEKGYRHQQQYVTELETAKLENEQELTDLREKEDREAKEAIEAEKENEAFLEFAQERNERLIKDMENLDPDAEEYHKDVAGLQAQSAADVRNFRYVPEPEPAPPGGEQPPPVTTAGPKTQPEHTTPASSEEILEYVNTSVSSAGVDPNDDVYINYARKAPIVDESGKTLTFDGQIKWAVDQTRSHYLDSQLKGADMPNLSKDDPVLMHFITKAPIKDASGNMISVGDQVNWSIRETLKYNAERDTKAIHESKAPLGRGTALIPGAPSPVENPVSLSDAIDSSLEKRRI